MLNIKKIVIPKVENNKHINRVKKIGNDVQIIVLIETPYVLMHLEKVLNETRNVCAIGLGGEDYRMKLGATGRKNCLLYPRNVLINGGRAYNIKVYDTVCFDIKNEKGF